MPEARHVVVIGGLALSLTKFRGPLLAAMVARGHRVTAMAAGGNDQIRRELEAIGVTFEELPIERAGMDPRSDLGTLAHLVRRLRTLRPDLVFGYTIKPAIYGTLAAALAGVPRRAAMITGLGYAFSGPPSMRRAVVGGIAKALYRIALRYCDVVIFHNNDNRDLLVRAGVIPRGTRVEVVRGSGVDIDHYAPAPPSGAPVTFLFLGRLLRDKGILELVEAAREVRRRLPATRFHVVGWVDPNPEGITHADVERWTSEGILEYRGEVDDVRPEIAACEVLVLPSYHEGTPRSVLEAMSMRRAVIATDIAGCRDVIVDGESGLLVPARDARSLAAAMLRLAEDAPLRERLAAAARARVEALYDAREVANRMIQILDL